MAAARSFLNGWAKLSGRTIRDEVGLKALRANRIDRNQHVVSLLIEDHQAFIAEVYEEAMNLGSK